MGRFHHSKKAHSEGRKKKNNKFSAGKTGNKKLDEDFVYTQKHKNIWNSFCNFLDEKFAEEDLSEILDAEEISRLKIPPAIPALLEFIPSNVGDVEPDEERRKKRSSLSGWIKVIEAEIQQGNGSRVETRRRADQPGSLSISEI